MRRLALRRVLAAGLALAAIAPALAAAGSDGGFMGPWHFWAASDNIPAGGSGEVVSECGPGERLAAGGFSVAGGSGGQIVEIAQPRDNASDADLTRNNGFEVFASIPGASPGSVTARAVCSARRSHAADVVRGLDPFSSRKVKTRCPDGTKPSGGGVFTDEPTNFLNSSYPYDAGDRDSRPDDGWAARAHNPSSNNSSIQVFALCTGRSIRYARVETIAAPGRQPGPPFSARARARWRSAGACASAARPARGGCCAPSPRTIRPTSTACPAT